MTAKGRLVLQGYFGLSETERKEVDDIIDEFKGQSLVEGRQRVKRSFETQGRITLGPVQTGCPCCGR